MIEDFQGRGSSQGTTDITLVERQKSSPAKTRSGSKREVTEITLVECQKISSLVEDGIGSVREFIGELESDEETKNIGADEVECSDDGPVVQLPFRCPVSPFLAFPVCVVSIDKHSLGGPADSPPSLVISYHLKRRLRRPVRQ